MFTAYLALLLAGIWDMWIPSIKPSCPTLGPTAQLRLFRRVYQRKTSQLVNATCNSHRWQFAWHQIYAPSQNHSPSSRPFCQFLSGNF
ncbi:hypothetical protein DFH08DRAFT_859471 [Mycena albidolilacea]|uniref:Secreted protein n=1 Tax=Mycena albidolilacea TaxID=1033008 RepID=A0AAD7AA34_9AGAR|nr:hypothetical protein DFH08DRAFT_859471 [Mycena albidolilacea]